MRLMPRVLLAWAAFVGLVAPCAAQVSVVESGVEAVIEDGKTTVVLPVINRAPVAFQAGLELRWLDPSAKQQTRVVQSLTLRPGETRLRIPHPLCEKCDPLALILDYRLNPVSGNYTGFLPSFGRLSYPRIAKQAFVLSAAVAAPREAGKEYELPVLARHPVSSEPIAGAEISSGTAVARTGPDGVALLRLKAGAEQEEDEIEVRGRLGDFAGAVFTVRVPYRHAETVCMTDKPIYQPGQTVRFRLLARGTDGRAAAGREMAVRILDGSREPQFSATLKSSKFGIAAAEWTIPEQAESGSYAIHLRRADGEQELSTIEVRRYQLPAFRVRASADRPFYLSGQAPRIEVSGAFLFGKPLTGGKVRITDAGETEAVLAEGVLDREGRYQAALPAMSALSSMEPYRDFAYAVSVTDPATNRREESRLDLRLSREPLHVYATLRWNQGARPRLYVSSFSPDGNPSRTRIEVRRSNAVLARGETNGMGLLRVDLPEEERAGAGSLLEVVASTADGASSRTEIHTRHRFDLPSDGPESERSLWIGTDRNLYRAGQPVICALGAVRPAAMALLVALNERNEVVFQKSLSLDGAESRLEIPYSAKFGRTLTLGLFAPSLSVHASVRRVYFPGNAVLKVEASASKASYRPGEMASLQLTSTKAAALGIAIIDQSVRERAAADAAFPGNGRANPAGERANRLGEWSETTLMNLRPDQIDREDLQLLAEVLAPQTGLGDADPNEAIHRMTEQFERASSALLRDVKIALDNSYQTTLESPRNAAALERVCGNLLTRTSDPWLQPFLVRFSLEGNSQLIQFLSKGPDKQAATADDFVALTVSRNWFAPEESLVRRLLSRQADYPGSVEAVSALLDGAGLRFAQWRDPWGSALRLEMKHEWTRRIVRVHSNGPDGTPGTPDDFLVCEFAGSYFADTDRRIGDILEREERFPETAEAFLETLARAGLRWEELRDPWGSPYLVSLRQEVSYTDQVEVYTQAEYNRMAEERRLVTPRKQTRLVIAIRSEGPPHQNSGFTVASFRRTRLAPASNPAAPVRNPAAPGMAKADRAPGGTGIITGRVVDPSGGTVPSVLVLLNGKELTVSDGLGEFRFEGLTPGKHTLTCEARGFKRHLMDGVPVENGKVTAVDMVLQVGSVWESVEVEEVVVTLSASTATLGAPAGAGGPLSTPRVRKDFPETLFWAPELHTDGSGRATVPVQLADSVTTWQVAVMASTEDGEMAEGRAELLVFQPFLMELELPASLTVGDEITLPAPVRNYLERAQPVSVTASLPSSLGLLAPVRQPGLVEASSSGNAWITVRALRAQEQAPVRVTAKGRAAADAVERSLDIRPHGERRETVLNLVGEGGSRLPFRIPPVALPGSVRGQIKLYPSLLSTVLEATEVLLKAPHGCTEQLLSSAYLSLFVLRVTQQQALKNEPVRARALCHLRQGVQAVMQRQAKAGGFPYWPQQAPEVAVTSYALEFLRQARDYLELPESEWQPSVKWLAAQMPADPGEQGLRVQALSESGPGDALTIQRELGALARAARLDGDGYALANFALAAMRAKEFATAAGAMERLRRTAQDEQGMAWWGLRANTPFYGRGVWGRVESTALAVTALARWRGLGHQEEEWSRLIDRGTLFLLRNAVAEGGWGSSQATVRALAALLETWNETSPGGAGRMDVFVNGTRAGTLPLQDGLSLSSPVLLDVSRHLRAGDNEVELRGEGAGRRRVQFQSQWYEPWGPKRENASLDLRIQHSTRETQAGAEVACRVQVSRPTFRGFGMMIAQVGLPPGAEVDRSTLTEIVERTEGVDSFELAPGRVTFYVWPRAEDVELQFVYRPRFAMQAHTPQSVLYDYYNPDERVIIAPEWFVVRP